MDNNYHRSQNLYGPRSSTYGQQQEEAYPTSIDDFSQSQLYNRWEELWNTRNTSYSLFTPPKRRPRPTPRPVFQLQSHPKYYPSQAMQLQQPQQNYYPNQAMQLQQPQLIYPIPYQYQGYQVKQLQNQSQRGTNSLPATPIMHKKASEKLFPQQYINTMSTTAMIPKVQMPTRPCSMPAICAGAIQVPVQLNMAAVMVVPVQLVQRSYYSVAISSTGQSGYANTGQSRSISALLGRH